MRSISPSAFMSSTIRFRHSKRSRPAYLPASSVIRPSKPMTVRTGRPWRRPISKSTGSCPGVTLMTPVPNFGSTALSATTLSAMAPVLRVHRQRGVAQLGLGPHGAESERPVLDVDELAVPLLALDLEVGQHRLAPRAPVDDVVALVDQPLFPQAHERLAHGGGE